jgi:hypothetical protein
MISRRNPSVLEAVASRKLFLCEKWVSLGKEYFLKIRWFELETGTLCSKTAYSTEVEKHMCDSKEHHLWQKLQHLVHCLPLRTELVVKEEFLQSTVFKVQKGSFRCKKAYSVKLKKHVYLPKKPIYLSSRRSSTLFSSETWRGFWREQFLQIKGFKVEKGTCVPYRPV